MVWLNGLYALCDHSKRKTVSDQVSRMISYSPCFCRNNGRASILVSTMVPHGAASGVSILGVMEALAACTPGHEVYLLPGLEDDLSPLFFPPFWSLSQDNGVFFFLNASNASKCPKVSMGSAY